MKNYVIAVAMIAGMTAANPAAAGQFQAQSDIAGGGGSSYYGSDGLGGIINDGGRDAFDGFGRIAINNGGLTLNRQVELLSENTYRFFDTFTNSTQSTLTRTISFTGNLGSDSITNAVYKSNGLLVSCQYLSSQCFGDPVLALVSGNNGLGRVETSSDAYSATFTVTVGAGQSISLLQYAFLASDIAGTNYLDSALAQSTGQQLVRAPRVEGLTSTQLAQVVNYSSDVVGLVPEPATWAMMFVGFGMIGAAARYRRRKTAAVYA